MHNDEVIKFIDNNSRLIVNSSHLHQHPEMKYLIEEAFIKFNQIEPTLKEQYNKHNILKVEIDMEEVIGKKNCILLNDELKQNVFYAQRKGRNTISKFIRDIEAPDCSTITFVVRKNKNVTTPTFYLLTAYVGNISEKEPLDLSIKTNEEFLIAKNFWDNHALIYNKGNGLSIYSKSIIQECPWDTFENRFSLPYGINQSHDILNKIQEVRNSKETNTFKI